MAQTHAQLVTKKLVKRLKEIRLEKNISHQRLADAAKLDRSTISRIESGERTPTLPVCIRLCDALGESLSDLLKRAGG